jgi:predicted nuclease of predicted toxin-antitoxin system
MDENVNGAITRELRKRGYDILTVQEDGRGGGPDPEIMDRATALGRVLFTQDDDLLREAAVRQANAAHFSGVVFAHQESVSIGQCVRDLEMMVLAGAPEDFVDLVYFLPF